MHTPQFTVHATELGRTCRTWGCRSVVWVGFCRCYGGEPRQSGWSYKHWFPTTRCWIFFPGQLIHNIQAGHWSELGMVMWLAFVLEVWHMSMDPSLMFHLSTASEKVLKASNDVFSIVICLIKLIFFLPHHHHHLQYALQYPLSGIHPL